jgi:hypothetical protein
MNDNIVYIVTREDIKELLSATYVKYNKMTEEKKIDILNGCCQLVKDNFKPHYDLLSCFNSDVRESLTGIKGVSIGNILKRGL